MSDDSRITVIKLANDGSNWVTFRDHMTWAFGSRQWAAHLTSTTAPTGYDAALWQREEASAMNLITASVPDHVFNRIKTKTSALEVWNAVKAIYQTRSKMITVDLGKKLQGTKLDDDEDACIHLTILLNLQEQLTSLGKNLDNDEFASILLGSLPPSYKSTINAINAAADTAGTAVMPDQVIRLVTDEFDRHVIKTGKNKAGPEEAFVANGQKRDK